MIFKGLIDQNYRVLNKEISQTNIDPSPDKVSFTIDGSTEDKTKIDFYETSSLIGTQDTPVVKAKLDLDNHNKIDSPTTNASPDVNVTFIGTQDTPGIKSSIPCDKKKNLTPLISCNQEEVDDIRANRSYITKSFLMNEIFDSKQEITSPQLQLQQEKLIKSKSDSCENEEKIVIKNLKSQITSYKTENEFLKEEMKSKQNILYEIFHQNSQLLNLTIISTTRQTKKRI